MLPEISGDIAKSTDAGATMDFFQNSPFQFSYLTSVNFADENTGYVSSGSGLLRTTDAGVTWDILNAPSGGFL
ncbi:MAG: hypothetical protein R3A12_02335 [Ignavibacteria bacterium]